MYQTIIYCLLGIFLSERKFMNISDSRDMKICPHGHLHITLWEFSPIPHYPKSLGLIS